MGVSMEPSQADLARARGIFAQCEEAANCHRDNAGAAAECVVSVIATALQAQREQLCTVIRERCEACGGTGYGQTRYDKHGAFIDGDECMYCGRPIAAIRAADTGSRGEEWVL